MGVLDTIERHVSVRDFLSSGVEEEDLRKILEAARRAPSAWNMQNYHVVAVRSSEARRELARILGGQKHVAQAPVVLVFGIDYGKLLEAAKRVGVGVELGVSILVESVINIGIAAGWAALAAEELGYGVVFIAVYQDPCSVVRILRLEGVIPVLGLVVGRPVSRPEVRRRQSPEAVYSIDVAPGSEARGEGLLSLYGEKAGSRLSFILGEFHREASRRIQECLREHGFKVCTG